MKKIFFILSLILALILFFKFYNKKVNLGNCYYKDDKNVYIRISSVLTSIRDCDSDNIFSTFNKIDNVDIATFEILDEFYSKDKNNVYFYGRIVKNANPLTFKTLGFAYGKDDSEVYNWGIKLVLENVDSVDVETFEVLSVHFSKDKSNAYFIDERIDNVDINTFEVLDSSYAKDKNHCYDGTIIVDILKCKK